MSHTQETVFVWKPPPRAADDPRPDNEESHHPSLAQRLAACNPPTSPDLRAERFEVCAGLIEGAKRALADSHASATQDALAEFARGDELMAAAAADVALPVAFLLRADARAFADQVRARQPDWKLVAVHSKECPNFRSTVKLIVNRLTAAPETSSFAATSASATSIATEETAASDRRLTYDFHVLKRAFAPSTCLFVLVEDTEGFDIGVVRELVAYMQTYASELRLHLVLNLHFPLALTEQLLHQSQIVRMRPVVLEGTPPVSAFVELAARELRDTMGVVLSAELVERVSARATPAESASLLRYALLAFFAGNPLAVASGSSGGSAEVPAAEVPAAVLAPAFNPNYRPLLEQALMDASLHVDGADRLSVPASVLYQLSRESSVYINIHDFYCAFREMVARVPDCADWEKQSMALFLEAVAELKMIGVLRDCKRKFECVEKASWRGV